MFAVTSYHIFRTMVTYNLLWLLLTPPTTLPPLDSPVMSVFGKSAVSGYSLLTGCPIRPALLACDASELRYSFACLPLADVFGWPASRIVQLRFMVAQSTNCLPACYFAAHRATRYKHSELSRHQPFSYHKCSAVILMSFVKLILA